MPAGCPPQQMRWRERGSPTAVAVVAVAVVGAVTSGQQPLSAPLGPLQPRPPLTSPATQQAKMSALISTECVTHELL
jgi:hypothetical protein